MNENLISKKFVEMGARVKVRTREVPTPVVGVARRWRRDPPTPAPISIDIRRDKNGEYFDILQTGDQEVEVVSLDKKDRHLLLMHRRKSMQGQREIATIAKFLCGHDERHWFVAAVPESASAKTVKEAKLALKPREVDRAEKAAKVKSSDKLRRRNKAMRRQGEWMFLPVDENLSEKCDAGLIHKNEPIRRGRGKPHICEELVRAGGVTVRIANPPIRFNLSDGEITNLSRGLDSKQHGDFIKKYPSAKNWNWRLMTRDMKVYARGKIKHSDHRTVILRGWHEVIPNTEDKALAMSHVAFLD